MIQALLETYQSFMDISKTNPIMSGILAVWMATISTWALRSVPNRIWTFIKQQTTTSLTINNAGYNSDVQHFGAFAKWFMRQHGARWSRNFSLNGDAGAWWEGGPASYYLGIGFGRHFFLYQRTLFWVIKSELASTGTDREKHQFYIVGLTRNHRLIYDLVEDFRFRLPNDQISIKKRNGENWFTAGVIPKRALDSIIIEPVIKAQLLSSIRWFLENEDWYRSRGMPYKLTIVLHGVPGTGKTSLIKALASEFNRDVYYLNLAAHSDHSIEAAVEGVGDRSILLMEDFDSAGAALARTPAVVKSKDDHLAQAVTLSPTEQMAAAFSMMTLSGLLNTLDGIISLDGVITFMTTNHIEKIDPALLRKGRVDFVYEIKPLEDSEIRAYIQLMYPAAVIPTGYRFVTTVGCDLQAKFLEHRDDYDSFLASLEKHTVSPTPIAHRSESVKHLRNNNQSVCVNDIIQ